MDRLQKALQVRKAKGDENVKECKCGRLYIAKVTLTINGVDKHATFKECYFCQRKGKK